MDINELLNTWIIDSEIDRTNPGLEAIKIPSLHAKYLKILSNHKLLLKKARNDYAELKQTKWNYYSGHYNTDKIMLEKLRVDPFKFILKQDMNIYIDSDKDLLEIGNKIYYYEEIVSVCSQIIASLKNRTWELKVYVDWKKFEEGN